MTATRRVTISISIPAAVHLGIGIVLTLTAIAAFALYNQLPAESHHRGNALGAGVVGAILTAAYWLSCCIQRGKAETIEVRTELKETAKEASEREKRLLSALEHNAEEIAENRHEIKRLNDNVAGLTKKINVLRDCYLEEGTLLVLPALEEAPKDTALGS
jgi:hypothetical protein